MPRSERGERGFTLVELTIAMLIAGILIALIFAVYTRMSVAYQAQSRITDVQQNLGAGLERIARELRLAGTCIPSADYLRVDDDGVGDPEPQPISAAYPSPPSSSTTNTVLNGAGWNGIKISTSQSVVGQNGGEPIRPLYVVNGGGRQPDEIYFFYADKTKSAAVSNLTMGSTITVDLVPDPAAPSSDAAAQFVQDELVLLVNSEQVQTSKDLDGDSIPEAYQRTEYEACLLQITKVGGGLPANELRMAKTSGAANPFNATTSPMHHCQPLSDRHTQDVSRPISRSDTMVYRFGARAYRIDPTRRDIGVLQWAHEDLGVILTSWEDLGIGFTNLQVATQWYEPRDTTDADATVDPTSGPTLDWYSGEGQETPLDLAMPVRVTLTLETRSYQEVDGIPTTSLPDLLDPTDVDHNSLGDAPAISLPVSGDPRYDGDFVFRYTTVSVDLRNVGVGR